MTLHRRSPLLTRTLLALSLALGLSTSCGPGPEDPEPEAKEAEERREDQMMYDDIVVPLTCEGVEPGQDCVEPEPTSLRMDAEERLGFEEVAFNREEKSILIRLKPGAELPERIKPGAPIYRARKDREAFMAIIEEVDQNDREVRLKVRPAKLQEVFRRGRLNLDIPIEVDAEAMDDGPTREAAEMQERMQELSVDLIDYTCTKTLINDDVPARSDQTIPSFPDLLVHVDLELTKCNLRVTTNVDAKLEWGGIQPDYFLFEAGIELYIALEVLAALSDVPNKTTSGKNFDIVDASASKLLKRFKTVPVTVGGVKVKLTPEIWAGVNFISGDDVSMKAGFEYNAFANAGFDWAAGRGFDAFSEAGDEFTQLGPEIDQGTDSWVRAWVRPEIHLTIAGLVTGMAAIEGYVEIDAEGAGEYDSNGDFDGKVCYDMDAGLDPILGAGLKFLGATLVDETWRLKGVRFNLDDGCLDSEAVEPEPACGASDECVIDSDCLPDDATSCTVYTCKSDCTCRVYEANINCCVTSADCDDGDPTTRDICSGGLGSCRYEPITGYCERDVDCDDGDFNTTDTCMFSRCQFTPSSLVEDDDRVLGPGVECFRHDQCDDGSDLTTDSCVANKCSNVAPPVTSTQECVKDIDCNDSIVFTEDTCVAGSCKHVTQKPGMIGN